jgi:hypothetical protein
VGIEEIRRLKSQPKIPKELRHKKPIAKKSAKKIGQEKEEKAQRVGGGSELDRWFKERRKEMTGLCAHCGDKSCKDSDQYYKFSIAHILPKNLFKSVKTHPQNWIELCFWNKSHHTNFDNKTLDIMELNCFDAVIKRFVAMYPDIAPKESKYIPDVLLQYVSVEL